MNRHSAPFMPTDLTASRWPTTFDVGAVPESSLSAVWLDKELPSCRL